jgi:hypothetical protein
MLVASNVARMAVASIMLCVGKVVVMVVRMG